MDFRHILNCKNDMKKVENCTILILIACIFFWNEMLKLTFILFPYISVLNYKNAVYILVLLKIPNNNNL